jgi:hypothetical protein
MEWFVAKRDVAHVPFYLLELRLPFTCLFARASAIIYMSICASFGYHLHVYLRELRL